LLTTQSSELTTPLMDYITRTKFSLEAIAARHLAFQAQHLRLLRLIWHLRRSIGDCAASFGISPQPWRLRRFLWHFAATLATAPLLFSFLRHLLASPASFV